MIQNCLPKYELFRHSNSAPPAAVKPFLVKYPPVGDVDISDDGGVQNFTWETSDHSKVSLSLSIDGTTTVGFKVERNEDPKEKSLMMKLVSIGYSSVDVNVRKAVVLILSELLDA